jgi:FMNH2-dependent dimethyl sulfone monooxygenase
VDGRPYPEIFQGGNSTAARFNGGAFSDWYFSNGKDFDGFREQYDEVSQIASERGRRVRFGLNGFVIVRDSEREAKEQLREIIAHADQDSVEGFRKSVQEAGPATADKKGMWADSTFEDLVQYNDGFRTKLIGTPEQVADRIIEYKQLGADLILTAFLHFQEELEDFGKRVIPIVREKEADLIAKGRLRPALV